MLNAEERNKIENYVNEKNEETNLAVVKIKHVTTPYVAKQRKCLFAVLVLFFSNVHTEFAPFETSPFRFITVTSRC